jgi:hypothetical protein
MAETIAVDPDVGRISEGLRDTGYEFNTAVADIIDNSIAASAHVIDVRLGIDFGGNALVSIGDDGCGMDRDGLINAMRYGSDQRANLASLGKFGLGLKTASTAFCKRLIVISRASGSDAPLRAVWDLEFIAAARAWSLQLDAPSKEEEALLNEVAKGKAGTVVLWDKIDRLLTEYKRPDGRAARNAINRIIQSLKDHIALVYQRFLDPNDDRAPHVAIKVNGEFVKPWDPFCLAETKEPAAAQIQKLLLPSGKDASFSVKAFILPRKEEFSSDANRDAARISNERQGVYVYRENRLIHGPDWLGMFKDEPHFSLLRLELSFGHDLDEAFQVDIKKSRILLNPTLYEWLRDKFVAAPRREAEARYRRGAAAVARGAAVLLHNASNSAIEQRKTSLQQPTVTSSDPTTGVVRLDTNSGQSTAHLRIVVPEQAGAIHIATATSLDNGVLWEASLIRGDAGARGNVGVTLNTSHPYYNKAYLPNKANSPMVQALDFLLWALAQAELNNTRDINREDFEEFRIEVSRNLRRLVADLPDPEESEAA